MRLSHIFIISSTCKNYMQIPPTSDLRNHEHKKFRVQFSLLLLPTCTQSSYFLLWTCDYLGLHSTAKYHLSNHESWYMFNDVVMMKQEKKWVWLRNNKINSSIIHSKFNTHVFSSQQLKKNLQVVTIKISSIQILVPNNASRFLVYPPSST